MALLCEREEEDSEAEGCDPNCLSDPGLKQGIEELRMMLLPLLHFEKPRDVVLAKSA